MSSIKKQIRQLAGLNEDEHSQITRSLELNSRILQAFATLRTTLESTTAENAYPYYQTPFNPNEKTKVDSKKLKEQIGEVALEQVELLKKFIIDRFELDDEDDEEEDRPKKKIRSPFREIGFIETDDDEDEDDDDDDNGYDYTQEEDEE